MWSLAKVGPIFVALAAVLVALAVACEDEEEASPPPGDTPTAAVAATPTATAQVPGITDTEILLGADVPLSGAMGRHNSASPWNRNWT